MTFLYIILAIIILPFFIKVIWVLIATCGQGRVEKEEKEIVRRANYLISKVVTSPEQLFNEMPKDIGSQFQGEWAIYTCSMTSIALANMATLYPERREMAKANMERIIDIALSPKIREYDRARWHEDPLSSLNGDNSHMSYLSLLAWMMGRYKQIGGGSKFDILYHPICEALHRRMLQSPSLNLLTYPGDNIYLPDMLVAIVALYDYSCLNDGKYRSAVDRWLQKARTEWIDQKTGLLASYLAEYGNDVRIVLRVVGSFSALSCYYLSLVDQGFAKEQYECLKRCFKQEYPFTGIKEYYDQKCLYQFDVDSGPIIFNLSPSGTAFAIGCATSLGDRKFRKQLLKTAEIAGSTITRNGKSHYLLSNYALVGEAVALAMRTSVPKNEEYGQL